MKYLSKYRVAIKIFPYNALRSDNACVQDAGLIISNELIGRLWILKTQMQMLKTECINKKDIISYHFVVLRHSYSICDKTQMRHISANSDRHTLSSLISQSVMY